ncbi:MAG: carboxymuconolactone decarboxylase family protein [Halioglobus sp.]|nr:carboxymuconolactone decarboxylase family protein [Halioglobus sp.]
MAAQPRVRYTGSATGNMLRDSALALVPETLDHYVELGRALWQDGPLRPAEIEVARLRNAQRVNCVFCRSARYDIAVADGLSEERVDMIGDAYMDSDLSDREKLIVAFTDYFLLDPAGMPQEFRECLQRSFSGEELAHLSLAVAYFSGFSRCAVALGGMPDELPRMQISIPE